MPLAAQNVDLALAADDSDAADAARHFLNSNALEAIYATWSCR